MNLPSDTPRLPKLIFLIGDALLLLAAWYIADQSARPMAGLTLVAIAICVAVAVVLGAFPFVADYARRQDEALDNRQRALQALAATVTSSSEQIAIAASGLDRLAGIAQENFTQSDRVAQQIREKMAELGTSLATARTEGAEEAARLEAVGKRVAKLVADFEAAAARAAVPPPPPPPIPAKRDDDEAARLELVARRLAKLVADLEAASRAPDIARAAPPPPPIALEVPPVLASQMVEIRPAVASSASPFMTPPRPAARPAAPAPASAAKPAPPAGPAPAPAPSPAPAPPPPAPAPASPPPAPAAAATAPEAAPQKRAPRKPAPAAPAGQDLVLEAAPAPDPDSSPASPEVSEPAISADGATRLVVTAYIGIGNRLFIRGSGPGLSWDRGMPLTFVSIGKWRWETNDASAAVKFRLYKNDEIECKALGERSVEPGAQLHLTAAF